MAQPKSAKKSYQEFVKKHGAYLDEASNEFAVEAGYDSMDPLAKLGFDPYIIRMLSDLPSTILGMYYRDRPIARVGGFGDTIDINTELASKNKKGSTSAITQDTIAHESRHRAFARVSPNEPVSSHKLSEELVNRVYDYIHGKSKYIRDQALRALKHSGVKQEYLEDIETKRKSIKKFEDPDINFAFHKYREYENKAKTLMDTLYNHWNEVY